MCAPAVSPFHGCYSLILLRGCWCQYAGGCSDEMGPTEIVPMSQFLGADDQDWSGVNESPTNLGPTIGSTRLTSPANRPVAVISHHAMIHRGCARLSDELDDESAPWRPSEPSTPRCFLVPESLLSAARSQCSSSSSLEDRPAAPNGGGARRRSGRGPR